jgi:hypothetical protein
MASRAQLDLEVQLKGAAAASKELDTLGQKSGVLGKAFGGLKGAAGGLTGGIGKMAGGFGMLLGPVGLAGAGITALGGVMVNQFIDAARESEEVTAQLNSVLTSTGGKAGVTAQAAMDLADALSSKSGLSRFSDEAVLSAENMLLTFTNIGKDVFPAATQTVLDMSQALGQDLQSSSVQLGKALNDPIAGISALSRVGVTFTDDQKKMIEKMVAAGDTMGAQKLILKELSTEFGGSAANAAATFSGRMQTLQERLGDVAERIGTAVMPMFEGLMDWLASPEVGNAIDTLANIAISGLTTAFQTLSDVGKWLADNVIMPIWNYFQQPEVQANLQNIANVIGGALVGAFNGLKDAAGWVFDNIIKPIWDYFSKPEVQDAVMGIANAIGATLTEAWNLVSGAATLAWNNVLRPIFDWFGQADVQQKIGEIATALGTTMRDAWNFVKEAAMLAWNNVLKPIWDYFTSDEVRPVIEGIANVIGVVLKGAFDFVKDAAKLAWDNVLKPIWDFFTGTDIAGAIGTAAKAVGETLVNAFNGLKDAASAAWDMIVTVWEWLTGQAVTDASTAATGVVGVIDTELIGGLITLQGKAKTEADIIGGNINKGMADAIHATAGVPVLEVTTMVGGAMQAAASKAGVGPEGGSTVMYNIGANMGQGMANGIGSKLGAVVAKAQAIVQAGIDAAKAVSDQRSPSKVYHIMGENDAQGYIEGLGAKVDTVKATTANLVTMGKNEADKVMGAGTTAPYYIMGEDHAEDYKEGWWSKLPEIEATVSNIQSTAAQRLAHLPEDDIAAIKAGGGLITDTLSQAILDTWPPLGEQILARFDETWGTAIERAQAMMEYLNNLNLYGSATGGPGASYTDFQPPPSGGSNSGRPVVPMAEGGDWMVKKPTLFLAHPGERATFVPAGKQGPMGTVNVYIGTVTTPNAREFVDQLDQELMRSQRLRTAAVGVPG